MAGLFIFLYACWHFGNQILTLLKFIQRTMSILVSRLNHHCVNSFGDILWLNRHLLLQNSLTLQLWEYLVHLVLRIREHLRGSFCMRLNMQYKYVCVWWWSQEIIKLFYDSYSIWSSLSPLLIIPHTDVQFIALNMSKGTKHWFLRHMTLDDMEHIQLIFSSEVFWSLWKVQFQLWNSFMYVVLYNVLTLPSEWLSSDGQQMATERHVCRQFQRKFPGYLNFFFVWGSFILGSSDWVVKPYGQPLTEPKITKHSLVFSWK